MKNLSVILNAVLFIAVGVLFYLHFSSGKQKPEIIQSNTAASGSGNTVAYIVEDTLINHYAMFRDLAARLDKKQQDLEAAYQTRANNLQNEIDNYRKRAPSMAPRDAQNMEEQLMQKQQNLYQYQQSLSQEMMDEQQKLNDQLYRKVSDFLKGYAYRNGYDVVLNYKRGSGMLYGKDMLDITDDVVRGLNAEYTGGNNNAGNKINMRDSLNSKK